MRHRMVSSIPHRIPIEVEAGDIDFIGHVNHATYLKWVQAAVLSHWQRLAPVEAVAAHVWVAIKHEITYRKPAFLKDEVVATVLLEKIRRESAFYETVFRRGDDLLAEVKSRWCCLDAETLRPTRLAEGTIDHFFQDAE